MRVYNTIIAVIVKIIIFIVIGNVYELQLLNTIGY